MQVRNRIKELRFVNASELIPNPKNWRTHPEAQQNVLRGLLSEVGYADALIARETDSGELMLLDGHLRAETTPANEVPVLVLDVNESEGDLILASHDTSASMAFTNNARLDELLEGLADSVSSPAVTQMLDALSEGNFEPLTFLPPELRGEEFDTEGALQAVEDSEYIPFVQYNDIYLLGDHRLMCGDSTNPDEVSTLFDGAVPNLMVTDPPYGVNYDPKWRNEAAAKGYLVNAARRVDEVTNDDIADWSEAWDLFPGDVIYCWSGGGDRSIISGQALQKSGFDLRTGIVWTKNNFPISRGHYTYQHEQCWYAVRQGKQSSWFGPTNASTVWNFGRDPNVSPEAKDGGHSTQKPLEAMERPLKYHIGDVYDPFIGSGTTMIGAERLGRKCFAMEIEPRYCDVVIKRWEDYTGEKAVKL